MDLDGPSAIETADSTAYIIVGLQKEANPYLLKLKKIQESSANSMNWAS